MKRFFSLFSIILLSEITLVVSACTNVKDNTENWDNNPTYKTPLNNSSISFADPSGILTSETPSPSGDNVSNLSKARANIAAAFTAKNPDVENTEYKSEIESTIIEGLQVHSGWPLYRDVIFIANNINFTGASYVTFIFSKDGVPAQDRRPEIIGHSSVEESLIFKLSGKTVSKEESIRINNLIDNEFDRLNKFLVGIEGTTWSISHDSPEISSSDVLPIEEGSLSGTYTRNYVVEPNNLNVKGTASINIKILSDVRSEIVGFDKVEFQMEGSLLNQNEIEKVNKFILEKLVEINRIESGVTLDVASDIYPIEIDNWSGAFQVPGEYNINFRTRENSNFYGKASGKLILKQDPRKLITTPNPKYMKLQSTEMNLNESKLFIKEIIGDFSLKNNNISTSEYSINGNLVNESSTITGIENIFKNGSKSGEYILNFQANSNSKLFKGFSSQRFLIEPDEREIIKDFSLSYKMEGYELNVENKNTNKTTTTNDIKNFVINELNKRYPYANANLGPESSIIINWENIQVDKKGVVGITEIDFKIKYEEGVDNGTVQPQIPYKGNAKIKIDLQPSDKILPPSNPTIKNINYTLYDSKFSGLESVDIPWEAPSSADIRRLWVLLVGEINIALPGFTSIRGAWTWQKDYFLRIPEKPFATSDEPEPFEFHFGINNKHPIYDKGTRIVFFVKFLKGY